MADTKADTEPAANQSGVNANEGAGRGNHCRSSGERVVENRVGLDSLTAMVAYLRPHFFELPKKNYLLRQFLSPQPAKGNAD